MDDDTRRPEKTYPLSSRKMSKTPSWVMLGFVLGAATVASLPQLRREKTAMPAQAMRQATPEKPAAPSEPPQLTTIEAVFDQWATYAVWDYDTTEVALWNSRTKGFTDFFEVRRYGNTFYFRSIPTLTRRIISRGKPIPESPLQFTETEEQYQEWRQHGRSERPVSDYRPAKGVSPAVMPEDPRKTAAPRPEMAPPPKFETLTPFQSPPVSHPAAKK